MTPPDITIINNFVEDPDSLFLELSTNTVWDERMKARKTASYGVSYNYSGLTYPQTSMPIELETICKKISREMGFQPNNCLLNYYMDGQSSMGYHSDSSEKLLEGTGVVTISLGAERHISYKSKADNDVTYQYKMKAGALLYMDELVQQNWLHAILKEKDVGPRISLTFRHILK